MRSLTSTARSTTSEHKEQSLVIEWANWHLSKYPELNQLRAIPNGAHVTKIQAAKLKREGMKSGIPDLVLPVARRGFNCLWIEMKRRDPKSHASKEQREYINALLAENHYAIVCKGADEAIKTLTWYLGD